MKTLICTALIALAVPLSAAAQSSPSQQQAPVEVEADRLDLDQRAGTAVYTGDVDIRQGEMQLRGDRVEIQRNDAGELSLATSTGE
ncbi:MAG: lipopolysaccharide transport periplasmic protein LptA, partial [Gammaproteobacteria bacterium]|nr:lipopolysaccharide transport periplasmic protein LptA [Gammaproteobacteria bacterium]